MSELNLVVSEDNETVTLTIPGDQPCQIVLSAGAAENLITALRKARAKMLPAVSMDYSFGQIFEVVADPAWRTEPDAMEGNSVLHLRDHGLGWLHFLLPREEARALAEILNNQASQSPQQTGKAH